MAPRQWSGERGMGAFGLIAILLATAIILALAVMIIPRYTGAGSGTGVGTAPAGKAGTPIQRAESVECMSNLNQIRQAITMHQSSNDALPASLQELGPQGVPASMLACPVGGSSYPYQYDPQSGRVGCRYPGHERH